MTIWSKASDDIATKIKINNSLENYISMHLKKRMFKLNWLIIMGIFSDEIVYSRTLFLMYYDASVCLIQHIHFRQWTFFFQLPPFNKYRWLTWISSSNSCFFRRRSINSFCCSGDKSTKNGKQQLLKISKMGNFWKGKKILCWKKCFPCQGAKLKFSKITQSKLIKLNSTQKVELIKLKCKNFSLDFHFFCLSSLPWPNSLFPACIV